MGAGGREPISTTSSGDSATSLLTCNALSRRPLAFERHEGSARLRSRTFWTGPSPLAGSAIARAPVMSGATVGEGGAGWAIERTVLSASMASVLVWPPDTHGLQCLRRLVDMPSCPLECRGGRAKDDVCAVLISRGLPSPSRAPPPSFSKDFSQRPLSMPQSIVRSTL